MLLPPRYRPIHLGYLQEIGPYFIEDGVNYKLGDKLVPNPDSWHKVSNLIFLESPAGVGYSYNLDTAFEYDDAVTANDSYNALLHFFQLYPEYAKNKFFIAG
jgi:carboxypeptidase C (cathepsin A)